MAVFGKSAIFVEGTRYSPQYSNIPTCLVFNLLHYSLEAHPDTTPFFEDKYTVMLAVRRHSVHMCTLLVNNE